MDIFLLLLLKNNRQPWVHIQLWPSENQYYELNTESLATRMSPLIDFSIVNFGEINIFSVFVFYYSYFKYFMHLLSSFPFLEKEKLTSCLEQYYLNCL